MAQLFQTLIFISISFPVFITFPIFKFEHLYSYCEINCLRFNCYKTYNWIFNYRYLLVIKHSLFFREIFCYWFIFRYKFIFDDFLDKNLVWLFIRWTVCIFKHRYLLLNLTKIFLNNNFWLLPKDTMRLSVVLIFNP